MTTPADKAPAPNARSTVKAPADWAVANNTQDATSKPVDEAVANGAGGPVNTSADGTATNATRSAADNPIDEARAGNNARGTADAPAERTAATNARHAAGDLSDETTVTRDTRGAAAMPEAEIPAHDAWDAGAKPSDEVAAAVNATPATRNPPVGEVAAATNNTRGTTTATTPTNGAAAARAANGFAGAALWWVGDRYEAVTTRYIAARGMAVLRIGYGTLWVLFLLREFGERDAAWGPDSPWSPALERQYAQQWGWPGPLRTWLTAVAGLTHTEFNLFYLFAIAVGVAFALGWRTRITSILFAAVVVALENRSPLLTDGGDNVLTLMSVYLAFTACGTYWSLDARRRARRTAQPQPQRSSPHSPQAQGHGQDQNQPSPQPQTSPAPEPRSQHSPSPEPQPRPSHPHSHEPDPDAAPAARPEAERAQWLVELSRARPRMVALAHNGAVLLVAAQICVIYGTAGMLKIQGSMWQDGSALGYVLKLDWFHPWPGLSAWLAGHALLLTLAGYVTVFVQAGFPFIVFSPRLKYPALAVLVLMHLSIAVLLGLPFFSSIMIVGDAVFLSDRVWEAFGRWLRGPAYAGDMAVTEPTLVYDGDCGFCTSSIRWLERWCRPAAAFVPWQRLDLEANGLTRDEVTHAVQWLPASPTAPVRSGAAAAARTLLRSRWPWRPVGALMLVPPISWFAALAYHVISVNRYRLPGGTPACAVPAQVPPTESHRPESA